MTDWAHDLVFWVHMNTFDGLESSQLDHKNCSGIAWDGEHTKNIEDMQET